MSGSQPADSNAPERFIPYGSQSAAEAAPQPPTAYVVKRWDTPPEELPTFTHATDETADSYTAYVPAPPPTQPQGRTAPYQRESAPGPSGRRAGAAYTPYSADAVKNIEKPRSERSWLVPAIIICSIILAGLLGASIYLGNVIAQNDASSPAGPAGEQPDPVEESAIRDVIRKSNEDQIKSLRDLDTEILKDSRTGRTLAQDTQAVQNLRSRNMYAVAVNTKLDILEIRVRGDKATAHTIETWTVTYYNKADNKAMEKEGPTTLDEVYSLVKLDGKWLVSNVDIRELPNNSDS